MKETADSIRAARQAAIDAAPAIQEFQESVTASDFALDILREYGIAVSSRHEPAGIHNVAWDERPVNTPYVFTTSDPDIALYVTGKIGVKSKDLRPTAIIFNKNEVGEFNGQIRKTNGENTALISFEEPLSAQDDEQALRVLTAIRNEYTQRGLPKHDPVHQDLSKVYR